MGIVLLAKQFQNSAHTALLESTNKFEKPRQRRHEIWLLTCYMTLSGVEKLVDELSKRIKVTDVYLAFDVSEIYREGPNATSDKLEEIRRWCEARNIHFEAKPLSSGSLVHSKGYAIIQRVNDKICAGVSLVTSANFTDAGFFGTKNVELGYMSTSVKDIRAFEHFYNKLWVEFGVALDDELLAENEYLFKYSLLSSGYFLHKWNGSLSQMLSIKYYLTDKAKQRVQDPELKSLGIEPGDTFGRQVLDLKKLPKKEIPANFTKAFTVETNWGRWCPIVVWDELSSHLHEVSSFIAEFSDATTDTKIQAASAEAQAMQDELTKRQIIRPVSNDHISRWSERIVSLRDNETKLKRLFTGYEEHRLPYDVRHEAEIEELFDSVIESIDLSGRKNTTMRKVLDAVKTNMLEPLLQLQRYDVGRIAAMMKKS